MNSWRNNNLLREAKIINDKMNYEEVTPREVKEKFGQDLGKNSLNFICEILNNTLRRVVPTKVKGYSLKKDNIFFNGEYSYADRAEFIGPDYIIDGFERKIYQCLDDNTLYEYGKVLRDIYQNSDILDEDIYEELFNYIEEKLEIN